MARGEERESPASTISPRHMEWLDKHFTDPNKNHLHVQNSSQYKVWQMGFLEINVDISNAWLNLSTTEWFSVQM